MLQKAALKVFWFTLHKNAIPRVWYELEPAINVSKIHKLSSRPMGLSVKTWGLRWRKQGLSNPKLNKI